MFSPSRSSSFSSSYFSAPPPPLLFLTSNSSPSSIHLLLFLLLSPSSSSSSSSLPPSPPPPPAHLTPPSLLSSFNRPDNNNTVTSYEHSPQAWPGNQIWVCHKQFFTLLHNTTPQSMCRPGLGLRSLHGGTTITNKMFENRNYRIPALFTTWTRTNLEWWR